MRHSALSVLQNTHAVCRCSRKVILFHLGFKKIYELYLFFIARRQFTVCGLYELPNFRLKQLWIYKIEIQVLSWKCARLSKLCWGSWTNFRSFSIPLFMDSSLWQRNLDSGFKSLVEFRIPWSVFRIPKTHDSGFHKQNFPRFRIRQTKISLIPESGFLPMGLVFTSSSFTEESVTSRSHGSKIGWLQKGDYDDGKGNKNGKKELVYKAKQQLCTRNVIHFLAIIALLRHETS